MAMRITADVVRSLATSADAAAADVAKAHGKASPGTHYGHVTSGPDDNGNSKLIASHRQLVWRGRESTRRAAAYYLGVIDALKGTAYLDLPGGTGTPRRAGPNELPAVRDALFMAFTGEVRQAYGDGLDEGNYRRSRITS